MTQQTTNEITIVHLNQAVRCKIADQFLETKARNQNEELKITLFTL